MNPKPWYMSKTVWFNVIAGVVAICSSLGAIVPATWMPFISLVAGIGNVILRFGSTQAIK